jgi:predicted anti-sigma-YlaC factor YlaD
MNCDTAGELLSARLDGELGPDESARLDLHLVSCQACHRLEAQMASLDRLVRVRPAEPVPDLVADVVARVRPARLGRGGWMRPALGWVALVLFLQSLPALVLGESTGADTHPARHLGAFGAALAIGFAFAAWKPHRAFGLLPFTAALVGTMVVAAAMDVIDGGSTALAEAAHVTELVGLGLLWAISGAPGWPGRQGWSRRGMVSAH